MTFDQQIINLAKDKNYPITSIESLLYEYYRNHQFLRNNSFYPYCVRSRIKKGNEIINDIKNVSYNTDKTSIKLARCNYDEQQVFYASVPVSDIYTKTLESSLWEIAEEHIINEEIQKFEAVTSIWEFINPLNLYIFPFSSLAQIFSPFFKKIQSTHIKELEAKFSFQDKHKILQDFAFISDMLTSHSDKDIIYRITSAFFNAVLKISKMNNDHIDGILYPSSNTAGQGLNLVLRKDVIDEKRIICKGVQLIEVKRNVNGKILNFIEKSNLEFPDKQGKFSL